MTLLNPKLLSRGGVYFLKDKARPTYFEMLWFYKNNLNLNHTLTQSTWQYWIKIYRLLFYRRNAGRPWTFSKGKSAVLCRCHGFNVYANKTHGIATNVTVPRQNDSTVVRRTGRVRETRAPTRPWPREMFLDEVRTTAERALVSWYSTRVWNGTGRRVSVESPSARLAKGERANSRVGAYGRGRSETAHGISARRWPHGNGRDRGESRDRRSGNSRYWPPRWTRHAHSGREVMAEIHVVTGDETKRPSVAFGFEKKTGFRHRKGVSLVDPGPTGTDLTARPCKRYARGASSAMARQRTRGRQETRRQKNQGEQPAKRTGDNVLRGARGPSPVRNDWTTRGRRASSVRAPEILHRLSHDNNSNRGKLNSSGIRSNLLR